ncbi:MAG: HAD-IC family P-type ATPase, partial [Gaiellaceae bacterium]
MAAAPPTDAAHASSPGDVALALESDELYGLSESESARRLDLFGPNLLGGAERPSYVRIAGRQLADPLTGLLLAAAAVSAVIGERFEAGVIAAIVVLNAVLGFFQEAGAERALLALSRAVELSAAVVRGGRERTIPAAELVRGDLIVVREGDRAPADARVVAAEWLAVDESALTGESAAVEKTTEQVPVGTTLADRSSMLYAGTGVARGRARALVTASGEETELGNIARLASAAKPPPTPLQRRLGALSRAMIALGFAVMVVLAAGMLLRGASLHEAFLVGVSVAVAAVPEGLAATVTIALAQGARAMAARGAIVRRLVAVETLGSASVIATDKTGTLTVNQLRLVALEPAAGAGEQEVLAAAVLASTAELVDEGDDVRIAGDHVDGAFLLAAHERGLVDGRFSPGRHSLLELPFDPLRKRLTVVYDEGASRRVVVKGALETLFARALLDEDERARLEAFAGDWARRGLRVLAVAER